MKNRRMQKLHTPVFVFNEPYATNTAEPKNYTNVKTALLVLTKKNAVNAKATE